MDPDLSFITPDIKLDQVPPLDMKRVIAFVNHFIMRNVQLLNSFAFNAERRILDVETRMGKLAIELQLLEAKLDSIPNIQKLGKDNNVRQEKAAISGMCETYAKANVASENDTVEGLLVTKASEESSVEVKPVQNGIMEEKISVEKLRMQDDPRYAKYFRMLRLGVVEGAVKQKMISEGVNPEILNNPNAESDLPPVITKRVQEHSSSENGDSNSVDVSSDSD